MTALRQPGVLSIHENQFTTQVIETFAFNPYSGRFEYPSDISLTGRKFVPKEVTEETRFDLMETYELLQADTNYWTELTEDLGQGVTDAGKGEFFGVPVTYKNIIRLPATRGVWGILPDKGAVTLSSDGGLGLEISGSEISFRYECPAIRLLASLSSYVSRDEGPFHYNGVGLTITYNLSAALALAHYLNLTHVDMARLVDRLAQFIGQSGQYQGAAAQFRHNEERSEYGLCSREMAFDDCPVWSASVGIDTDCLEVSLHSPLQREPDEIPAFPLVPAMRKLFWETSMLIFYNRDLEAFSVG